MDRPHPAVPFDAGRAMRDLDAICRLGPRVSGTAGMRLQQSLLLEHFGPLADRVELRPFEARQPSRPGPIPMANLVASWTPERRTRALVCCHHDTRPIADQEPDPRDWTRPFVGANDGASGVALLMELARQVRGMGLAVGLDVACFDGEECIFEPEADGYFLGSSRFAADYLASGGGHRYIGAVLLDMVAGVGASFPVEGFSAAYAGPLVDQLWSLADELGCDAFRDELGEDVFDDHLPLLEAGIPAVDIIDVAYPHWHRLTDTLEHCDPEGLEQVARVVTAWLGSLR